MAKVGRKKIVTKLIGREKHLFVYTFGNDFPHVEPCRYLEAKRSETQS